MSRRFILRTIPGMQCASALQQRERMGAMLPMLPLA
jgi:hypothetical protein